MQLHILWQGHIIWPIFFILLTARFLPNQFLSSAHVSWESLALSYSYVIGSCVIILIGFWPHLNLFGEDIDWESDFTAYTSILR